MTIQEIERMFEKTIDQFYAFPSEKYIKEAQLFYIGGILQSALHILPNENYFNLKKYVYVKHGYDPGGVRDGQITFYEYTGGDY